MPSTSPKQKRLMAAASHDPEFAKKVGVPQSVAKEFNAADYAKAHHGKHHSSHHRAKALMNLGHYAHPKKRMP